MQNDVDDLGRVRDVHGEEWWCGHGTRGREEVAHVVRGDGQEAVLVGIEMDAVCGYEHHVGVRVVDRKSRVEGRRDRQGPRVIERRAHLWGHR